MRDWQDDGAPTIKVLKCSHPTSKADRLCDVCSKIIRQGERYRRDVYLEDGEFKNVACHDGWERCEAAEHPADPYALPASPVREAL